MLFRSSSSAGNSAGLSPAAALSCAAMSARKREPSLFTYRMQTGDQETGESIGERTYQLPVRSRLHNVTICMDNNVVRSGRVRASSGKRTFQHDDSFSACDR